MVSREQNGRMDDWMRGIKETNGREERRRKERKEGRKDVNTSVF